MPAPRPPLVEVSDGAERIRVDPQAFLGECNDRYGPVFTVEVDGGKRITYVLDPHVFQPLLTAKQVDFSPVSRQSKKRFGLGRVVETDDHVKRLSASFIKSLRGKSLRASLVRFEEALAPAVEALALSLDAPQVLSLQDVVQRTLMPATVFGLFGDGIYDRDFVADFMAFSTSIATRFAGSNPELAERGIEAEVALMERLQVALEPPMTSVVEHLHSGVLETPDLTPDERHRTLLMLMWGSMVNLLPTSAWMLGTVFREPSLVAAVREEAAAGGSDLALSIATETLRLFSRPNMYRQVVEDFELPLSNGDAVTFTSGDWLALFPRFLHHDPSVFHRVMDFDARRFYPVQGKKPTFIKDGKPLRHATVVFGLGRGRCPGDSYALSVLTLSLRVWLDAFDGTLTDAPFPVAVTQTVSSTPEPSADIEVLLSRRLER